MYNDIKETYKKIKPEITSRIDEFNNIWKNSSEKELFIELAFCLLTPQSKAKNAWKAISSLVETDRLFTGQPEDIVDNLNIVRFKNNKSRYVILARNMFSDENGFKVRELLNTHNNTFDKRNWLIKNVKGMGIKEASHFLRNIGFSKEIAILDRHILKNLLKFEVIKEIPKSLTHTKYFEIEEKMSKFSKDINIPLDHLDFIFWYNEAGEVFK